MKKITFNDPEEVKTDNYSEVEDTTAESYTSNEVELSPSANEESDRTKGLSQEELNDPNKIRVTIDDQDTPVVVLFGPPACGKTMTLVRLTRYLNSKGYVVSPVRTFRPSFDSHYTDMCDSYNDMVDSENAAESTSRINFMLLKVSKQGRPICQILEAPGEHYYQPGSTTKTFPRYINNVIDNSCRKIWVFVLEPDWKDRSDRSGYVSQIKMLKNKINVRDKAVFLFNKVDKTDFIINQGNVNISQAIQSVKNQYNGIFEPFRNDVPILKWFQEYKCKFVPFSTGTFNKTNDGGLTFEQGADAYPANLWSVINGFIKG